MGHKKSINFIIPIEMYRHEIWFSFGESDKKFVAAISERMHEGDLVDLRQDEICSLSDTCNGRTFHHNIGGQTIIRMPSKPKTAQEHGTLSHEIFHAVYFILKRIGISLVEGNDEVFAYFIGYVTECAWLEIGT